MFTLLLKVAPPLQSWGVGSKFPEVRSTMRFPSKSGVVGMIASAMGWGRDHDLTELRSLRMGVRIDEPGVLEKDFQTSAPHADRDGVRHLGTNKISSRWYLADAIFLVGLECPVKGRLERIAKALDDPIWPIYAGRKGCPLNPDLVQGISGLSLEEALQPMNSRLMSYSEDHQRPVEFLLESASRQDGDVIFSVQDEPISFDLDGREWANRTLTRRWLKFAGRIDPLSILKE